MTCTTDFATLYAAPALGLLIWAGFVLLVLAVVA